MKNNAEKKATRIPSPSEDVHRPTSRSSCWKIPIILLILICLGIIVCLAQYYVSSSAPMECYQCNWISQPYGPSLVDDPCGQDQRLRPNSNAHLKICAPDQKYCGTLHILFSYKVSGQVKQLEFAFIRDCFADYPLPYVMQLDKHNQTYHGTREGNVYPNLAGMTLNMTVVGQQCSFWNKCNSNVPRTGLGWAFLDSIVILHQAKQKGLVKLIVNELNQPPFNLNLTNVTFNALHPPQLLQLLSDVLCEIESKNRVDISDEPVDALALRLLTSLQIFKFKPETEDPNDFREGLISGRPDKINPILHWLLQRREELKKRAYLSRFLVKIDIAPEMRSDSDVIDLYEQYEFLIEEFKQRHKQFEASQIVNDTVTDLRKDLQSMEDDREVLIRRIERTQRKVEGVVNYNQLLSVAKKLRAEKEKNREFQAQKEDQKSYLSHLESRRQRLINQLTEIRQTKANTSGQMLLQRAEDAIRVNQYMINEKLNKETQLVTANIALMEKVLAAPNPTSADLQIVIQKSDDFRSKIAHLTEKRALQNDPIEDGMALYRQQSLITSRKKEACAERLNDLTQEMNALEAQLQAKKQQLGGQSETALTSEQFKTYVSDLRVKSNVYKQRRAELNDLKAEYGILSRTLEILRAQEGALSENLDRIETQQGVKGFRETRDLLERISDEKANTDEEKGRTLEEMSNLVRILNSKISEKKVLLAPLLRELRPLRQTYQESLPEYEAKRREYEAQVQLIENTIASIANVKSELENEIVTLEERCRQLEADIKENEAYLQRATDEMKLYVSGVQQQQTERGKSVRDQLQHKIAEQEKLNAQLRQDQRQLKDNLPQMEEQMKYWEKLEKIFRVKILCQEKQKLQEGTVRRERGRETLVLQ
ncbi:hypothetical protein GHT06_011910 [Daphnia sinensis]|uniref:Intraflagellar transport protein 81 homolog n=1 Tax=Daphnia sinensis TaxID=1820382 RepID=A0AAD5PYC6_9CRUS|nr:hypothetical protein GHT06_011910 [Daphnia sinensis]